MTLLPVARRMLAALAVGLAALAAPSAALAHATLVRSEPADGAMLAQAPAALTLTYNEPVSPLVLRLLDPAGGAIELTDVTATNATVTVALPSTLSRGTHLLSWRVISADGHPVGGALAFSIGAPTGAPAAPTIDRALRLALWAAKLVLYAGLFIGVGGAAYAGWIAPVSARMRRGLTVVLAGGLVAVAASVGLQGLDALGLPLSALAIPQAWAAGLESTYGITAVLAAAALLLAIVVLRSAGRALSAMALILLGLGLAASGHAAAADPQFLTRPAVFIHALAVAIWVGALWPLAQAMGAPAQSRATTLARFSRAIPAAVVALVLSGGAIAIVQLGRLDALWTTDYGLVLTAKIALVLALLALAAGNRLVLTPKVLAGRDAAARQLGRVIAAELMLVVAVLGLVAAWRFTPPPRALTAARETYAHLHGARAMADVTVAPAAGGRQVTLALLDPEFRALSAKEVTLSLSRPGFEALRLNAKPVEGPVWRIDAAPLPVAGPWQVRIEILINDFEKFALDGEIEVR